MSIRYRNIFVIAFVEKAVDILAWLLAGLFIAKSQLETTQFSGKWPEMAFQLFAMYAKNVENADNGIFSLTYMPILFRTN